MCLFNTNLQVARLRLKAEQYSKSTQAEELPVHVHTIVGNSIDAALLGTITLDDGKGSYRINRLLFVVQEYNTIPIVFEYPIKINIGVILTLTATATGFIQWSTLTKR
jgi:hypothetical protein